MDEDDDLEMANFYADPKLNYFAHFLFYLAVSFLGFGLVVACIQLFEALSSVMGGGPFDMEPEGGWLRTLLIIAGISFLIAAVHCVAFAVEARKQAGK
jgi:hypothetical protein